MNESVDERLRIFEQRLNSMDSRLSQKLEQSLHQLEELEFRFSNDSSRLSPDIAKQLPDLVNSWAHGRFRCQNDLVAYVDATLGDMHGSLNRAMTTMKGEIHDMLSTASESMASRIEECVEARTVSIENRLTSTDMMLSNMLAKQAKAEEAAQAAQKPPVSDAKERTGREDQEDQEDRGGAKVRLEDETSRDKGDVKDDMKSWLNKQVRNITDDAHHAPDSENLEGVELLSWMRKHVHELVSDLLPSQAVSFREHGPQDAQLRI